jgi:ATP-dependent Clp protease ATP-binding subunit ClpX
MEVPLLISDATRFSGTGYVGESVDSLVQDLVTKANGDLNKASRGIIYLDEIDKIAAKDGSGRDVSGRDVQNGLLKIVEKGDVKVLSNQGPSIINTKDILFVGGGAFTGISNTLRGYSVSESSIKEELNDEELLYESSPPELIKGLKKFGIIPELLGRMPVIAKFRQLEKEDLVRILKESEDTPIKKYEEDFKAYGIKASFSQDCYETIAGIAYERGMGARGLKSVIEESLTPFKFHLPGTGIKDFSVSSQTVLHPEEALLSLINDSKNKPIKNESQNKCKEVKKWQKHNQAPKNKNNT